MKVLNETVDSCNDEHVSLSFIKISIFGCVLCTEVDKFAWVNCEVIAMYLKTFVWMCEWVRVYVINVILSKRCKNANKTTKFVYFSIWI